MRDLCDWLYAGVLLGSKLWNFHFRGEQLRTSMPFISSQMSSGLRFIGTERSFRQSHFRGKLHHDTGFLSLSFSVHTYIEILFLGQIISQTLNPTWDETLVFDSVIIYGSGSDTKRNPPNVVVEVFDHDQFVSFPVKWPERRCEIPPLHVGQRGIHRTITGHAHGQPLPWTLRGPVSPLVSPSQRDTTRRRTAGSIWTPTGISYLKPRRPTG